MKPLGSALNKSCPVIPANAGNQEKQPDGTRTSPAGDFSRYSLVE